MIQINDTMTTSSCLFFISLIKHFNVLFLGNIIQLTDFFLRSFSSTYLVAADPSGKFHGTKEVAREGLVGNSVSGSICD